QPPPAVSIPLLLPFVRSRSPAADPFSSVFFPPQPSRPIRSHSNRRRPSPSSLLLSVPSKPSRTSLQPSASSRGSRTLHLAAAVRVTLRPPSRSVPQDLPPL
ncbi:hypothetical protein Csa_023985, partial [Cucumis sativus]